MAARRFVLPVVLAITLVAIAIALRGKGRLPDTPEAAARAFFAAAEQGDADAYLGVLNGPLKNSFEETKKQLGAKAFSDSLRTSVSGLKGYAVTRTSEAANDLAALDVELVFTDRSERQRFGLIRESGGWLIASIDRADVAKPDKPYGATVYDYAPTSDSEPEPPVSGGNTAQ
jgi:hypothetical protein